MYVNILWIHEYTRNPSNTPKESAKSVYFRTSSRPHLLNYIVSDGPEAACGVGPGGGGGGLRPLVHLRGGGRELNGPRHLLRGQQHGPGWPLHQFHGGAQPSAGEGSGDGGQYYHHHHGPHHCGTSLQLTPHLHPPFGEEGGGAPGQGAQQSGGNGVYNLSFLIAYYPVRQITYATVLYLIY